MRLIKLLQIHLDWLDGDVSEIDYDIDHYREGVFFFYSSFSVYVRRHVSEILRDAQVA